MTYQKPQIIPMESALGSIQAASNKGSGLIDENLGLSIDAYQSDE